MVTIDVECKCRLHISRKGGVGSVLKNVSIGLNPATQYMRSSGTLILQFPYNTQQGTDSHHRDVLLEYPSLCTILDSSKRDRDMVIWSFSSQSMSTSDNAFLN